MTAPSSRFDLCCLLWAHPGQADAMAAYEDRVLALFPDHGIELLERDRLIARTETFRVTRLVGKP